MSYTHSNRLNLAFSTLHDSELVKIKSSNMSTLNIVGQSTTRAQL